MRKLFCFALFLASIPSLAQTTYTISPGQCDVFSTNTVCGPTVEIDPVTSAVIGQMALNKLPSGALFIWQYDVQGQHATYTAVNADGTFAKTVADNGTVYPAGSVNPTYFTQTVYSGGRYRVKRTITYMTGTITKQVPPMLSFSGPCVDMGGGETFCYAYTVDSAGVEQGLVVLDIFPNSITLYRGDLNGNLLGTYAVDSQGNFPGGTILPTIDTNTERLTGTITP